MEELAGVEVSCFNVDIVSEGQGPIVWLRGCDVTTSCMWPKTGGS